MIFLFAPSLTGEMTGLTEAQARTSSPGMLGLAAGLWFAFRNPLNNRGVMVVAGGYMVVETLAMVINSAVGDETWGKAVLTIVINAILMVALVASYLRAKNVAPARAIRQPA